VEAAGEGWRIGVEAVGEGGDCVGRERRAVDLGGFQQEGQSYRETCRDAGELYREESKTLATGARGGGG
jgi:hypothetical protein